MEKDVQQIAQIDKGSMRRVLGIGDVFAVGFGDLGSSIFYALGITALYALGATPIALMIAGLVFACTALSYAELSSMIKEAGGSASYSRYAFNDLISFIAGWGLLLDYIVTIAISAFSVAPYLSFFFPILQTTTFAISFTVILIVILLAINIIGTKHSTRISWILTSLTVVTQFIIIAIGAVYLLDVKDLWNHLVINGSNTAYSPSWSDFAKGCAMAMVAYTGVESMAQLSSEAKKPEKTVPKAIIIAMVILLAIYIGLSSVALSAVTPQVLSTQYLENPVAGIVAALPFGSNVLGGWVGLLAAILLFVAANAGLIGASRLCFNMSEFYQIPRFMYKLHPRSRTPYVALTIFAILAAVIVVISEGQLSFLADLYNFGAMMAFFSAHLSLIFLRIRKKDAKRPFKVPFNIRIKGYEIPISALIGAVATFATWLLVVITKPDGRYLGTGWILFGLAMYFYYRKKQKISPIGSVFIKKISIKSFEKAKYKHILVPLSSNVTIQGMQTACELAKTHNAEVTAVQIIEVPFSLPLLDDALKQKNIETALTTHVDALAREFHVPITLKIIQARSVEKATIELLKKDKYDFVVLTASEDQKENEGAIARAICKNTTAEVIVCYSDTSSYKK